MVNKVNFIAFVRRIRRIQCSVCNSKDAPSAKCQKGSEKGCMARALYDNIAESPDELAFRRGDLLTVLEQNTGGSEGWWLCSLRGRQGICPGNRLRIVAGVFDASSALQRRRTRTPAPVAHQPMPAQQSPAFTKIEECSHYDVPRAPMPVQRIIGTYDCPRLATDLYDAPRAPRPASADSACSGTGSLTSATSSASANSGSSAHSAASASSTYDVPRTRALPLPCDAALEALERLQEEASAAVSRLLSYVSPGWRRRGALRPRVLDVRVAGARLRAALHDLAVFADATLANAHDAQDKGIAVKLRPLVKALKDAERITHEATSALDAGDWAPERLEREREPTDGTQDALDQLVACARSLTEDVRRAASFIHGNASLLFRRSPAVPEHEWTEEYDYVRLESRTAVGRRNAEIRAALPDKLRASFDALVRDADHAGEVSAVAAATRLPPDDRQLAAFYAAQTATYGAHLSTAVEAFLRTIEMGQPPDVFLAHGKFVVLSAHRIVHVGDTVHRSAQHAGLKAKILRCSDALSDALAATVTKTKAAALQFPCASAVTDMAESARTLASRAQDLRRALIRAAEPPQDSTPATTVPPSSTTTPLTPLTPIAPHGIGSPSLPVI
ncbi:breast cancer anti-estrogen resistance protein 1 isoform X1 [Maniola hyperantus]|uniref:breast cancer anti-estrogen resistance protein 1 isoform X1 n=1 Tax=Aphantopus hyperantus TaxID=2795564 RepID=UPI001569F14E|nr:breast cancer anti-estrogen resistance protein 1 isoform X1 [Maniola hyperantus]